MITKRLLARWTLCFWLVLAGCSRPVTPPPAPILTGVPDTTLGPGDVFVVTVFDESALSGKFCVSATGTIDYPLVGRVNVAGKTPPEVATELRKRLAQGYINDPHVTILVESYQSKKISVFGQVKRPGTFNYVTNMSIIEAITLAGGFTALASRNDITLTRVEQGKSRRTVLPVADIGEGRASNFILKPGDVVFVPERVF
jgi:polysaccharide export outer membrane protein